jgi:hypothetical protein
MDSLQAYHILMERIRDEDRLILERITILLVGNSILAVAFFEAAKTGYFYWIRYALPIVGIILSLALAVVLGVSAAAAIKWYDALCKVEEEPEFAYMKDRKIRPFTDIGGMRPERKQIWKVGYQMSPLFSLPIIIIWSLCMALPYP